MSGGEEWSGQVRVFTHVCHCAHMELREQLIGVFLTQREKKVLSSHHVGLQDQIQVISLAASLYPLSHLDGQGLFFFNTSSHRSENLIVNTMISQLKWNHKQKGNRVLNVIKNTFMAPKHRADISKGCFYNRI